MNNQHGKPKFEVDNDRNPVVVFAIDENFAMPLAATIRSILDNLSPNRILRIYILDGGVTDLTKARLERSWPKVRYQITWIAVDSSTLCDLPISGGKHYNLTVYYRILMPWLLPSYIRRAIHLDADMIACTDLGRLWDEGFEGHACLAVQSLARPFIDAKTTLTNYDRCCRYLVSDTPVPNFRELGLNPRAPYFNAGLFVADIAAWRTTDMPNQLLNCLRENRPHVQLNDQYALNVVLSDCWKQLDLRWNQTAYIFKYPSWSLSPFDRETFEQLRDDPYIIHFTSSNKPWLVTCLHPSRKLFFEYLDRTAWAGWRPSLLADPHAFFRLLKAHQSALDKHAIGFRAGSLTGCSVLVAPPHPNARNDKLSEQFDRYAGLEVTSTSTP